LKHSSAAGFAIVWGAACAAQEPLSAIDWLDDIETVALPVPYGTVPSEPPTANAIDLPDISVSPLEAPKRDAVGLLPGSTTGLPATLWHASPTPALIRRLDALPDRPLPAVQSLYYTLLLAEANAPEDAGQGLRFLSSRIATLRRFGAVEPALALVERAGGGVPQLFDQWLDLALLNGTEDPACAALRETPGLSTSLSARIFCLARAGDWDTAVLIYHGATSLGALAAPDATLLALFLDPEMIETTAPPPAPEAVTALQFRLYEAVGAALSTRTLPRAFAMADLRGTAGWKAEIEAAERLARTGALAGTQLLGLYTARKPAASGGVWDRASAVQALDTALTENDAEAVADALPAAWDAAREMRLETVIADLFAERLMQMTLPPRSRALVLEIALLSPLYESAAQTLPPVTRSQRFATGLAQGAPSSKKATTPTEMAIADGFARTDPAPSHQALLEDGRLGEAMLSAATQLDARSDATRAGLGEAIATLRAIGLEDTARRAALQILLLEEMR
jgi:hypothetical protein